MADGQTVDPILVEYDKELHAVSEKYRAKYPDRWFWYSAARMKFRTPQKPGRIEHKTEIVKSEPQG